MAAIIGTLAKRTEFAGDYKAFVITATVTSSSDTITLTGDTHGISEIQSVSPTITGGMDAAFLQVQVSFSGLVITVASFGADGLAATDFTGTTISLLVVGR